MNKEQQMWELYSTLNKEQWITVCMGLMKSAAKQLNENPDFESQALSQTISLVCKLNKAISEKRKTDNWYRELFGDRFTG